MKEKEFPNKALAERLQKRKAEEVKREQEKLQFAEKLENTALILLALEHSIYKEETTPTPEQRQILQSTRTLFEVLHDWTKETERGRKAILFNEPAQQIREKLDAHCRYIGEIYRRAAFAAKSAAAGDTAEAVKFCEDIRSRRRP